MTEHTCFTSDSFPIHLGMTVRDYDNRVGVVVHAPRPINVPGYVEDCERDHWWGVCHDTTPGHVHDYDGYGCTFKEFNGCRMQFIREGKQS